MRFKMDDFPIGVYIFVSTFILAISIAYHGYCGQKDMNYNRYQMTESRVLTDTYTGNVYHYNTVDKKYEKRR